MINKVFEFGSLFWGSSGEPTHEEAKTKLPTSEDVLQATERCKFPISSRQFAHRLVPAYMDKSPIVGIASFESGRYWIQLISSWLENKPLAFPNPVSREHLTELLEILDHYTDTLKSAQPRASKAHPALVEKLVPSKFII